MKAGSANIVLNSLKALLSLTVRLAVKKLVTGARHLVLGLLLLWIGVSAWGQCNPIATVNAGAPDFACQSLNPSSIPLTGASFTVATSAAWSITSGGGTLSNTNQTPMPQAVTYTPAANYSGPVVLTLTTNDPDGSGPCNIVSATKIITINPVATVNAGGPDIACQSSNPSPIILTGARFTASTSAAWSILSGGGTLSYTSQTATPETVTYTPAANYSGQVILILTANDPDGTGPCSSVSAARSISIHPAATVSAGPPQTICTGSPITTATMDGSFGGSATSAIWSSTGSGTFNDNSPTAIYTVSNSDINAGSVTLTYTTNDPDGQCGFENSSMVLTIRRAVNISTQPSNVWACSNIGDATLSVIANGDNLAYQWYKGGIAIINGSNISGAQSSALRFSPVYLINDGNYYVVVSGVNPPCSSVQSNNGTLNVDEPITIDEQPASQARCIGSSVTFTVGAHPAGELTFQWRKNGTNISGANSSIYTISRIAQTDEGNYDVLITGQPGYSCNSTQSSVAVLTMSQNVGIPVFSLGETSTICQGAENLIYTATAANSTNLTYSLDAASSAAGNSIVSSSGDVVYTASWNGTTVVTASATGCNGPLTATHTVKVNPTPAVNVPSNQTYCSGVTTSAIPLNGTPPGVVYDISGGIGVGLPDQTGVTAIPAFTPTTGTATIYITPRANNCTGLVGSYTITVPRVKYTAEISDYNGYNISCHGKADGFIKIDPLPDLAPYVFRWSGPNGFTASTEDIPGLLAGQYILSITEFNNCTVTDTFDLREPLPLSMTIDRSVSLDGNYNINCAGGQTGFVNLSAVNNVGQVVYMWGDGYIGKTRPNLSAGNYKIIITDLNFCQADSIVSLNEPEQIKTEFDLTLPFCPDSHDGEIRLNVTGGIPGPDYAFNWSDNSTGRNLTNIPQGFYKVTVFDINGCTVKDSVRLQGMNKTCLVIPEAISPNKDLINDVWNIENTELYPQIEITIYNRWGQAVWISDRGYSIPWDGRSKGEELPIDSYHYVIDLHNGSKPIIGAITIIR